MIPKLLTIKEVAQLLGVTMMTLRRWDKSGKLQSIRIGERGHRFYREEDIEMLTTDLFSVARRWTTDETGKELKEEVYCQNSSVFQARLQRMESEMTKIPELKDVFSLISSTTGEIGNNSFDHNIGLWRDIPGIFFAYNLQRRIVVLADRGQGVWNSLKRVRPNLKNDEEALKVAFTEVITGRAPEQLGNGLKYVRRVITKNNMILLFQTGNAGLKLQKEETKIKVERVNDFFVRGCLAYLQF